MKLNYAIYSTAGIYRPINEDCIYANGTLKDHYLANYAYKSESAEERQLFAVFDGMGGEPGGKTASNLAAELLTNYKENFDTSFQEYITETNRTICERKMVPESAGTTMAALYLNGDMATVVSLGDSRIYYLEKDSKITQLNEDHTEFATLLKYGVVKEEDYHNSPARNHLTRLLGSKDPSAVNEPFVLRDIWCKPGDFFLLCTDGFYGNVGTDIIERSLDKEESLLTNCIKLGKAAADAGSDDNITIILVKVISY